MIDADADVEYFNRKISEQIWWARWRLMWMYIGVAVAAGVTSVEES